MILILGYLIFYTASSGILKRSIDIITGEKIIGTVISISKVKVPAVGRNSAYEYYIPRVEVEINGENIKTYTANRGKENQYKIGEKVKISYKSSSEEKFTII